MLSGGRRFPLSIGGVHDRRRGELAGRAALEAEGLAVHFAGVKAVDGVDIAVEPGAIVGLIGPNGAGKTTLLNAVTGFQRPHVGRVSVFGSDATRWAPARFAGAGITRTFQNARLFSRLTAAENLEAAVLGVGASRRHARDRATEVLGLMGVEALADRPAAELAYGDQRRLSLARALAPNPRLILLDEPAAGLNEQESDELFVVLRRIRDEQGCGLLVVEHDMRLIMRLCDLVHVLDHGRTLKVGRPEEVQRDAAVLEAYLGTSDHRSRARTAAAR